MNRSVARRGALAVAVLVLFLAALNIAPLATLLNASFDESPLGEATRYGFGNWANVLSDRSTWQAAANTLAIGIPRTAIALFVATMLAWLVSRTNIAGRRWIIGCLVALFFLPDLPWILAWMQLGAPRAGLLNSLFPALDLNVYSYWGLVILGAARLVPMMFIFLLPAFKALDASLEDAARVSGAGRFNTLFRVSLPLVAPALASIGIVSLIRSMESFELEQLIGVRAGITVLSTRIYDLGFTSSNSVLGEATATAMILLLAALVLLCFQIYVSRRSNVDSVTGKGHSQLRIDLGAWHWPAVTGTWLFIFIFGFLPFMVLFLSSFMAVSGFFAWELFTLDHWRDALLSTSVLVAVRNTFVVSALAATACAILAILFAIVLHRTRWPLRSLIEAELWIPLAVPGLVLSLAFLWAFVDLPLFGTLWILVLVMSVRGLPISVQQIGSNLLQIDRSLDDAARLHGAGWTRTVWDVLLPLLAPAAIAAWIIVFTFAVRTVDAPLLLTMQGTRLLSVDIFYWASGGRMEGAIVLAMMQTLIILVGYLVSRFLLTRSLIGSLWRSP